MRDLICSKEQTPTLLMTLFQTVERLTTVGTAKLLGLLYAYSDNEDLATIFCCGWWQWLRNPNFKKVLKT